MPKPDTLTGGFAPRLRALGGCILTPAAAVLITVLVGCGGARENAGGSVVHDRSRDSANAPGIPANIPNGNGEPVCDGAPKNVVVVAMRSHSDLELARRYSPKVIEQAEEMAVASCGSLTVGLAGEEPSQTVLHTVQMIPAKLHAYNARPIRNRMRKAADAQINEYLTRPLAGAAPGDASPFLSVAAFVRGELEQRNIRADLFVIVGDAVVVERSRGIDARYGKLPAAGLRHFVPELRGLPCTVIVGAALGSTLPDRLLRSTLTALEQTFARAKVQLLATPSDQLPVCETTAKSGAS
jgi:hypothetical protein